MGRPRRYHMDHEPDNELPWLERGGECMSCRGPTEFVGTGADVEIHECMHCRQQHRSLEGIGRRRLRPVEDVSEGCATWE